MAITIGSNNASLRAQRAVAEASDALSRTFERLSSGQRINRASDDAAGLAVTSSLSTRSRVFSRAVLNISDGISALAIADSTVEQLGQVLTRLVELTTQAANGSYSAQQRKVLNLEAQALRAEYFRIAKSTKFNDLNLFDGTLQGLRLQAGFGTDGSIFSYLGGKLGTGTVGAATDITLPGASFGYELADLNGDGVKDLITAVSSLHSVAVALGKGDGTFGSNTSFSVGNSPYALAVGDVNNDGVLDIATANSGTTTASILIGRGDGTFLTASSVQLGANPTSVKFGDLNADGKLDLVAANITDGNVSVLLGQGNGNFNSAVNYSTDVFCNSVGIGDLNGDGILDIASANASGGNVSILLGTGDGTFGAKTDYTVAFNAGPLELGDLNGDGALDIITTQFNGGFTYSLLNKGNGTFGAATVPADAFISKLGDMNGDGILDLVCSDMGDTTGSIRLGNGDGTFGAATSFAFSGNPAHLALGDLNGDGVLDVVMSVTTNAASLLGNTRDGINPILDFSLGTQADALQALAPLRNKLDALSAQRGTLGSFQARLGSALATLNGHVDELRGADSRIRDTDVAKESADLIRFQILQQSGAEVLRHANIQPQLALKLLNFV